MKERVLRAALAGLSAAALVAFIGLAALRIAHPFALDASEGAWLDESARAAQSQAIYVAPSISYVPLPAMPGFPAAASVLIRVFGARLWVLRLLASIAALGIAWLAGLAVRRETDSALLGMVAAGLWLGAFAASGTRFDVGRPETFSWLLVIGALVALRFTRGIAGAIVSALLLSLGFFTWSLTAAFGLATLVHVLINDRPRLAPFALTLLFVGVGGYVAMARWLGPWFTFYTWDVTIHGIAPSAARLAESLGRGVVGTLGPLAVSCMLAAALPTPLWRGPVGLWTWAALGGCAASLAGSLGPNALSPGLGPAVVVLAIAGPVALTRVVNHVAAWPGSERAGRSWALQGVLLLQFMALAHGFRGEWPDARARAEYPGLVERLRSLHGPVLAPGFGTLALQTGHAATFHPVALEALVEAKGNGLMTRDPDVLDRMLEPLAKGEERPTLVSDRRLDDPASSASPGWMESVRGYRLDSEWKELADSPAPRFVYVPISGAAPRPSPAPIAGAIESNPDSAHAQ